jgi:amidase
MNRKNFLRFGSLAGMTLTAWGAGSCSNPTNTAGNNGSASTDTFEWKELTIEQIRQRFKDGSLSSRQLTEAYLNRIREIDQAGIGLHAVIEINPDALAIAEERDKELKEGKARGALHGIPVLIKDNIDTADQMKTTAGSLALANHTAQKDAFIVQQLRKAGAVIIGKTNLSEWANFRSTRSSSGWSSRGGQTRNPYFLDRSPCGSSSGSATAVAANLCMVAVGTETDGSVIAPASFCGIVGMKPTVGLLSRSGIIPISATQDTAGPMARTVTDAALLLGALTGVDETDAVTSQSKEKGLSDYTAFLKKDSLKGKRIGYEASFLKGRHEAVVALYQQAINTLKEQGAEMVEVELLKATRPLGEAEFTVLLYEFKDGLNKYLGTVSNGVKSMGELIAYNKKEAATLMPYFQQELVEMSMAKGELSDKEYKEALSKSTSARNIIDELLQKNKLDAIIGTSYGPAGCIDLVNGDSEPGFYFAPPAAMAGYPHITVPMGDVHGLPVGLSFIAGAYQEGLLFSLAYAYEQVTLKRKVPEYKPALYPTDKS